MAASYSDTIKQLEICRVAPTQTSSPDSAQQTSLPSTFFDLLWLRFPPVKRIFFYETSQYSKGTFLEKVLPKLKHSLSVILGHYLPLAGNLTWPQDSEKPFIKYAEGDTISLAVAESEADFHRLSSNEFREAEELELYVPSILASDAQAPVMALQVTSFANTAGFSIGYAAHHAVLDGKTSAMFMHSWASICRQGEEYSSLTPELTPFYDRTLINGNDPDGLETAFLKAWLEQIGPNRKSLATVGMKAPADAMLGTFRFTKADIDSIKECIQKQIKPEIHLSTFTITVAYVWVCLLKARKVSADKVHLALSVDCRGRLEPPTPPNYFGNCIIGILLDADPRKLVGEDGVSIAATALGEAIGGINKEVLKGAKELLSKVCSVQPETLFSFAGSPRFELYNTDFGWGRPRKVEVTSITKTGAFSLSDPGDDINGGIEVGVVLKRHEIEAFASLIALGLKAST